MMHTLLILTSEMDDCSLKDAFVAAPGPVIDILQAAASKCTADTSSEVGLYPKLKCWK